MPLTRKQKAIGISVAVHAILLVVLLFWVVPRQSTLTSASSGPASSETSKPTEASGSENAQPTKPPPAPADVSNEEIKQSVESQIESVERLSDEQKLSELEKNLRRLESIADQESVQQTATAVAESLGIDTSQYSQTPTTTEGNLDISTAQISDVSRTKSVDGSWRYVAVMIDVHGHQSNVPMDPEEGKTLYDTFQLMKQYPMAKGLYRSVVMPMLQKLTAPQEKAQTPSPAQNQVIQPQSSNRDDF